METPTQSCRQKILLLQLIKNFQIKSETDELELVKEKSWHFLYHLFC